MTERRASEELMRASLCLSVCIMLWASQSRADVLLADSIICETEQPLALLRAPNLVGQSGSVVMTRVRATIEFEKLMAEAQGILGSMAAKEERIRADANMRGSSQAQGTKANVEQQSAKEKQAAAEAFVSQCMATSQAVEAIVIERRPISGLLKINMPLNGVRADVWTVSSYVQGQAPSE